MQIEIYLIQPQRPSTDPKYVFASRAVCTIYYVTISRYGGEIVPLRTTQYGDVIRHRRTAWRAPWRT